MCLVKRFILYIASINILSVQAFSMEKKEAIITKN